MKKIIIFGYNPLSFEAISRLDQSSYDLLVVETDPTLKLSAEKKGFKVISVDFRSDDNLKEMGIGKNIETIFCFLPEDSSNIFLTLSARAIDKNLKIISVVEAPHSAEKMIAAGADKIIDPYQICGQKIYNLIKKPYITHLIDHTVFGRHDLHVAEITIPENSPLEETNTDNLTLIEQYNLVLIGIIDKELGEKLHFTIGEKTHKLNTNDIIVVLGPSRDIKAFKKEISHV